MNGEEGIRTYTKDELIEKLQEIRSMEWIQNARPGNAGGIGNTLEDLLGIEENNLPIPNASEWELKCQRMETTSLATLFHLEPSPRAMRFVPKILLPLYGWKHQGAGGEHPEDEMSFRQTITGNSRSDRGFKVVVDRAEKKVLISFDASAVNERHSVWLKAVEEKVGLDELNPQPYWGFNDLEHKAGTKLLNCFYIQARTKRESGRQYYSYERISVLTNFSISSFIRAIENGFVYVDFDARTRHNHGTKFRLRQGRHAELYENVESV